MKPESTIGYLVKDKRDGDYASWVSRRSWDWWPTRERAALMPRGEAVRLLRRVRESYQADRMVLVRVKGRSE